MFHESYRVTIKTSRFAKFLQAVEESADWVLLIGVAMYPRLGTTALMCVWLSFQTKEALFAALRLTL